MVLNHETADATDKNCFYSVFKHRVRIN